MYYYYYYYYYYYIYCAVSVIVPLAVEAAHKSKELNRIIITISVCVS
jgi:hypothetical protein